MTEHDPVSPTDRPGGASASPDATAPPIERENAYLELLKIAAPSVATMSSYTVMQFVDKLMVARIGPEPVYVAAQSNAGILCWTLMTFAVGVAGVVSSFVSQNLGAGKPERGAAYAWTSMWIALVYWAAIMLPVVLLVPRIYGWLHADTPQLVQLEVDYAQVVIAGGVFTLMSKGLHNYFFGLHKAAVVMVAVVTANLINIFFSMAFVFGTGGFPLGEAGGGFWAPLWPAFQGIADAAAWVAGVLGVEPMGIRGAAWGTVLANSVELLVPLAIFLSPAMARVYATRAAWRPNLACLKDLARVGWPGGVVFVNEMLCWSMLMVWLIPAGGRARAAAEGMSPAAVDEAGVIANTTGWITLQWMHLAFMPTVGVSIAAQAMIGKAVGAGRPDVAAHRTWLCLRVAMAYMTLCAVGFVLFRHDLVAVFINADTDPETTAALLKLGGWMLIAVSVFQLFDAMALIMSAALRGAGDTVWPGVATVILCWSMVVGVGSALIEFAPRLGALGPWIGASLFISLLGIVMTGRFLGGRWRTLSLVKKDPEHDPAPVPEAEVLANPGPGPDPGSGLA
jgi:MATE family multidrug resistance protein